MKNPAKEKVIELREKFRNLSRDGIFTADECVKIMVDEILRLPVYWSNEDPESVLYDARGMEEFWKDVKSVNLRS